MGDKSAIAWTDATWNVVIGCTRVSAGCRNCYAAPQAARLVRQLRGACAARADGGTPKMRATLAAYEAVVRMDCDGGDPLPEWSGEVRFLPDRLDQPLRWRKPRRIFVDSMSDLFHERVTDEQILRVWTMMRAAHWHTFQVCTKRAARMASFTQRLAWRTPTTEEREAGVSGYQAYLGEPGAQPLSNVHLYVSAEDQAAWDARVPLLLQCPAAVRGVSVEPMLGPIDGRIPQSEWVVGKTGAMDLNADRRIRHLIVGGESGPAARPCDVGWVRSLVKQCRRAGVAVFVKQDSGAKAGQQGRIPDDLWIKEWPKTGGQR